MLVVPGQPITAEQGYLRGHGSHTEESDDGILLISSVAGQVERVNKLISVRPLKSRYVGEIGDLVCGRVTAVESKRWKVNIGAHNECNLQLTSVNLVGGAQRIRTTEDQLQMRTLFSENDLISAEIQNISTDGVISLHARTLKYGKLCNGQLIIVPSSLIKPLPQHYVSFPWGIDVLLGRNGYIWITRSISEEWKQEEEAIAAAEAASSGISSGIVGADGSGVSTVDVLQRLITRHANTPYCDEDREKVARMRNVVNALSRMKIIVTPEAISTVYLTSIEMKLLAKDMIHPEHFSRVTASLVASSNPSK